MRFDYSKLKGRVVEICGTQSKFSNLMNMSERTVSLKFNNTVNWKQDEIIRACKVLKIPFKEIEEYFFKI